MYYWQSSKPCYQVVFLFVANQDEGSVQSTRTNEESGLMAYENRALPEKTSKEREVLALSRERIHVQGTKRKKTLCYLVN